MTNPEIGNTPVWALRNIWRLGQVRNTKFATNVSNKMPDLKLLPSGGWVNRGKISPPTQIRVKTRPPDWSYFSIFYLVLPNPAHYLKLVYSKNLTCSIKNEIYCSFHWVTCIAFLKYKMSWIALVGFGMVILNQILCLKWI